MRRAGRGWTKGLWEGVVFVMGVCAAGVGEKVEGGHRGASSLHSNWVSMLGSEGSLSSKPQQEAPALANTLAYHCN